MDSLVRRVAERYASIEEAGLWDAAVKDLTRLNTLILKLEKKPSDKAAQDIAKALPKLKGLKPWVALCCAEDKSIQIGDALRKVQSEPTQDNIFALRDVLQSAMGDIAPASFTYKGFKVQNPERASDQVCHQTLDAIDFLVALFKKRGVENLLHEGVSGVRILPSPVIGDASGNYVPTSRLITLNPMAIERGGRQKLIDWVHHSFLHEFGHHVHLNYLHPEAVAYWDSPWGEDAEPRDAPKPMSVTPYGRRNKYEDFAETFVAFMAAPDKLTDEAEYRMKRTLALSGLYGKSVGHFASRVPR